MFINFFIIIIGFILLIYGADLLVKGASGIAKRFHIAEIIIGLTIVSLGTSLPELIITLVSSSSNSQELIIGNVIGSNLCNLLLILGILTIMKPIHFKESTVKLHLPILILINILVLVVGVIPNSKTTFTINFKEGLILLFLALIYLSIPLIKQIKNKESSLNYSTSDISKLENSLLKSLIFILLGGFALKYGGDFVVNHSIQLAQIFNISESIIGLTIIAFGTSLPELITSVVAIIKGNNSIAEGNIIGSCILNFTLILGFGATVSDIVLDSQCIENLILLIASSTLIWLYSLYNKDYLLKSINGFVLLIIFIIYLIRLFAI